VQSRTWIKNEEEAVHLIIITIIIIIVIVIAAKTSCKMIKKILRKENTAQILMNQQRKL